MSEKNPRSNKKTKKTAKRSAESTDVSTKSDKSSFPRNKRKKQKTITEKSIDTTVKLKPNIQDFEQVSTFSTFVDHTELIMVFYEENASLFIAAPKRFGKSTNMNMIKRFFDITGNLDESLNKKVLKKRAQYKLFKNLKIVTEGNNDDLEEHLGMHPVIFVDFKGCGSSNLTDMYEFMFQQIKDAFTQHRTYLNEYFKRWEEGKVESKTECSLKINETHISQCNEWFNSNHFGGIQNNKTFLSRGLFLLCQVLYNAYRTRRVVILIDELDALITQALKKFPASDIDIFCDSVKEFLTHTIKGAGISFMTQSILITGESYISATGTSTDIKLSLCAFLDDTNDEIVDRTNIIPFYGLNQSDLDKLLDKLRVWKNLDDNGVATIKEKINKMFNGYQTKDSKQSIYPLYDVISYLISEKRSDPLMPPILASFKNAPINHYIAANLMTLCGGGEIEIKPISSYGVPLNDLITLQDSPSQSDNDIYFQLLMATGFLSRANTPASDKSKWKVRFVNETMKQKFIDVLRDDKIQLGGFLPKYEDACAQRFRKLQEFVLTDCSDKQRFERMIYFLTVDLKNLFNGFKNYKCKHNEFSLKMVISNIVKKLYTENEFSFCSYEQPITDKNGNSGKIDIWLVDEVRKFAMLFIIKCCLNESIEKETIDLYVANEERGSVYRKTKVYYPAIFDIQDEKTGVFTRGAVIGLTVDEYCRPSFSVALRRNAANGIEKPWCVSDSYRFAAMETQEIFACNSNTHVRVNFG